VLGWQPRITELEEIVRTAWAWHKRSSSIQVRAS
jgi:UDP-glucose 4-epimerase